MRLTGKVALVSGAGSGLGAEITRAFHREGARVVVTDVDEVRGKAHAASIDSAWHYLDVRDESNWAEVMQAVAGQFGRVDVVVNNAGVIHMGGPEAAQDPENLSLENWRAVHAINLEGTFLGCKYAIKTMRESGHGSIINIASRAALVGVPGATAYGSSKAAICNHTKSVALYCAEQGLDIRCNAILPGSVITPLWDPALGNDATREAREKAVASGIPMRRFGQPGEISPVAVMLASNESSYITGAQFVIDGGVTAGSV